jgi:hypothetical protein
MFDAFNLTVVAVADGEAEAIWVWGKPVFTAD